MLVRMCCAIWIVDEGSPGGSWGLWVDCGDCGGLKVEIGMTTQGLCRMGVCRRRRDMFITKENCGGVREL